MPLFFQIFNLVHPADSFGARVEENDRTRNETVQDEVYCSILEKAYKMYKVLTLTREWLDLCVFLL